MIGLYNAVMERVENGLGGIVPLLARFVFAAVLLIYFLRSGVTKLGDGFFGFLSPSDGAYIQIFPKAVEAAGYDTSQLNILHWAIALGGTWAEFILPVLILLGLFTRLAALGMIGFTFVQSFVDVTGHGVGGKDLGAWFDGASGALIMDQRTLWVFVFIVLIARGGGALSFDRVLGIK